MSFNTAIQQLCITCATLIKSTKSVALYTFLTAYLLNTDSVVLVADYREAAAFFYPIAVELSEDVGKVIANILNNMAKFGLDPQKLHVIGHSLGSNVAGYVGRNTNFRIPRITGKVHQFIDLVITVILSTRGTERCLW